MQNLINHLKGIVENSIDFGCAIVRVARDLGIDIDVEDRVGYDIFEDFPEHFSIEEFRLAIVTAIVRHFDPTNQDSDRIPALRSTYEHMSRGMLSGAEMQSYHTMMFMLHPKPATVGDKSPKEIHRMGVQSLLTGSTPAHGLSGRVSGTFDSNVLNTPPIPSLAPDVNDEPPGTFHPSNMFRD